MATTVSYERTGLDTGTGNRSAARMAGGVQPDGTYQRRPAIPEKNFQEMFQEFTSKQEETKRVKEAAQKARNNYEGGGSPTLDAGGSRVISADEADRTLTNTAKTIGITNQGYANKQNVDLNTQAAAKAGGLGPYNGTGGGVVTDVTNKGAQWMMQSAASDAADRAWNMSQRAANTAQSGVDAQRAVGLGSAQAQKYAATVAANAQRDAAAYSMIGQFAGQGGYKYWGG